LDFSLLITEIQATLSASLVGSLLDCGSRDCIHAWQHGNGNGNVEAWLGGCNLVVGGFALLFILRCQIFFLRFLKMSDNPFLLRGRKIDHCYIVQFRTYKSTKGLGTARQGQPDYRNGPMKPVYWVHRAQQLPRPA